MLLKDTNMLASKLNYILLCIARDAMLNAGFVDINEPEADLRQPSPERFLRATLLGGVPALIFVARRPREEWRVSIALWPAEGAEEYMSLGSAGARAGEAFACGWLNTWHCPGTISVERFHDAVAYVAPHRKPMVDAAVARYLATA